MSTSKPNKRKRYSQQLSLERKVKRTDWRFVPYIPELMDKVQTHNPEDKMIAHLDGDVEDAPENFDYHQVLEHYLTESEAAVLDLYLMEGITFQEIGYRLEYSRQWVHTLYHRAIDKLRPHLKDFVLPKKRAIDDRVEMNIHLRGK